MNPTCNVCKKSFKNERGLRVHRAFTLHHEPKVIAEAGIFSTPPIQAKLLVTNGYTKFAQYITRADWITDTVKVTILEALVEFVEKRSELAPAESLSIFPPQVITDKNPRIEAPSSVLARLATQIRMSNLTDDFGKVIMLEILVKFIEEENNAKRS